MLAMAQHINFFAVQVAARSATFLEVREKRSRFESARTQKILFVSYWFKVAVVCNNAQRYLSTKRGTKKTFLGNFIGNGRA